jgi:hypothetical protein
MVGVPVAYAAAFTGIAGMMMIRNPTVSRPRSSPASTCRAGGSSWASSGCILARHDPRQARDVLLTLPVVFPVIVGLGYEPIWIGILLVRLIEVGVVTPPVGLNCYVVNGMRPDIPLESVFKGVSPFLVDEVILIGIIVLFPDFILLIPKMMMG